MAVLTQPLVSRPAYGQGVASTPVAESGLPSGTPGGKGLTLDKDIPGESTFNKPESDIRDFDKADDGSIYRKDGPDDLAKPQKNQEQDERHHEQFKPTYAPPGGRPPDDPTVTNYPYRDGIPHQHNASEDARFVVGLWLLRTAHAFTLQAGTRVVVAARPEQILTGLNPAFQQRAAQCSVTLKRADVGNMRWLFAVDCGNGAKVVKMKAFRPKNITRVSKMDVDLSCSCPAWQWLGPEHHSKREDYLDGKPRGTAGVPVIRDPSGVNRVCKHVAAVLSFSREWEVPRKPGG